MLQKFSGKTETKRSGDKLRQMSLKLVQCLFYCCRSVHLHSGRSQFAPRDAARDEVRDTRLPRTLVESVANSFILRVRLRR